MDKNQTYETLDPENWDEMRALAHRMVDDAITYLQTVRERPVWQPMPEEITARFNAPAPNSPSGAEAATRNLRRPFFRIRWGISIRVFGLVLGTGPCWGAGRHDAATMNPNLAAGITLRIWWRAGGQLDKRYDGFQKTPAACW